MTGCIHQLFEETNSAKSLLASLAGLIGDDAEVRETAVEGETQLVEALQSAVARDLELDSMIDAAKATAKRLSERISRLEKQRETLRAAMVLALETTGKKRLETPIGTLALMATQAALVVTEEADIPSEFWKPQPPKLDKTALKKALKDKREVAGARLSNGGMTVQITTN